MSTHKVGMVLFPTFTIALTDTPYNINHLTAKAIITNLVGKKKKENLHILFGNQITEGFTCIQGQMNSVHELLGISCLHPSTVVNQKVTGSCTRSLDAAVLNLACNVNFTILRFISRPLTLFSLKQYLLMFHIPLDIKIRC